MSATPRRNIGVGWEWVKVNQRTFLFQTSRNANFRISYPCDGINAYMFAHIPPKVDCELVRRNYAGAFKSECMFRRETRCLLTNGCNDRWSSWISCPTFVICYLDWGFEFRVFRNCGFGNEGFELPCGWWWWLCDNLRFVLVFFLKKFENARMRILNN